MGLFKKGKGDSDFELEVAPHHERDTLEPSPAVNEPSAHSSVSSSRAAIKQGYGIEDAIALMRKLPNVNSEITITVVKKTLESANIQVEEIISDAERKETQIETRTKQLSTEISELQERIAHLNDEINELTSDLKETTKVKNLLVGAAEEEKSQAKASAEAPKKSTQPPASQASSKTANTNAPNASAQPKDSIAVADKA
jgi:TolA-binding protein